MAYTNIIENHILLINFNFRLFVCHWVVVTGDLFFTKNPSKWWNIYFFVSAKLNCVEN